jgi:guanidinopropionase
LLDPKRTIQIGIRRSLYEPVEHDWARAQGIRVLYMGEFVERGPAAVIAEARQIVGDGATHVSFDIDSIDPSMAPGTGTPEIGGFSTREAQQMVRLLEDLNIIDADVVEVSPPFDLGGITALAGASIAFELLCVLAKSVSARTDLS